jgi:hypothetical protein
LAVKLLTPILQNNETVGQLKAIFDQDPMPLSLLPCLGLAIYLPQVVGMFGDCW